MPTQIPNDTAAEVAVLGACLLKRECVEPMLEILDADFFYKPLNGQVFQAIKDLYGRGDQIDCITVDAELSRVGLSSPTTGSDLIGYMNNTPAFSVNSAIAYAKIVEHTKMARDLMRSCQDTLMALSEGGDPFDLADDMTRFTMQLGTREVIQEAMTIEQLLEADDAISQTVIPGLLKVDHRVIFTARSGSGKSTLLKFIGFCAAQGIQPFTRQDMTPVRVLCIDAENPIENITQTMDPLRRTLMKRSGVYNEDNFKVFRRPGGMNIRNRRDRTALQREIAFHQPQLVVAGPAYKLSHRRGGEPWEEAADEFNRIWDDLRIKYNFALILEAHTSKSQDDMSPQGSAFLTQWAEVGIALVVDKTDPRRLTLDRFRGDRLQGLRWPSELTRDPEWLWNAKFS